MNTTVFPILEPRYKLVAEALAVYIAQLRANSEHPSVPVNVTPSAKDDPSAALRGFPEFRDECRAEAAEIVVHLLDLGLDFKGNDAQTRKLLEPLLLEVYTRPKVLVFDPRPADVKADAQA